MNRKSSRICGRNTTTAPTPAMTPSTTSEFKSPGGITFATTLAEPTHSCLQGVHRVMRKGENALKHQRHKRDEDQRAPDLVGQQAVELVTEIFPLLWEFGSHGLLDFRNAVNKPFNRRSPPINPLRLQSFARRGYGVLNFRRVMRRARRKRFFVTQQQQSFRSGLQLALLERRRQQIRQRRRPMRNNQCAPDAKIIAVSLPAAAW